MNKEEKAFHYLLDDYMQIPKTWEDYQIIKNAIAENKQLKDNWNKLKEWVKEEIKVKNEFINEVLLTNISKDVVEHYIKGLERTLDKMQEIEGGMNE